MRYIDKIGYRERIMAAFSLLTFAVILILYFIISSSQEELIKKDLENRIGFFSSLIQNTIFKETDSLVFKEYDSILDSFAEYDAFKFFQIVDSNYVIIK